MENTSVKSTEILYGGRSPMEINRAHVVDVLFTRLPKYRDNYWPQEEVIDYWTEQEVIK